MSPETSDPGKPDLMVALVKAARHFPDMLSSDFCRYAFENTKSPTVKAYAVAGLYRQAPQKYRRDIYSWLEADNHFEKINYLRF